MSTTQPTVLTYEDAQGEPLVQLVHKSIRLTRGREAPPRGSQKYQEAPEWAVEFLGRYDWQRDGGGLPRELGNGRPDEIAATSLADAMEALTRIGHAMERWMTDRAQADATLVATIAKAATYGLSPELPLGYETGWENTAKSDDDQAEVDGLHAAHVREHGAV